LVTVWCRSDQSASTEAEIDAAFAEFSRQRIAALLLGTDPFFNTRRDQIVALANRLRIAAIYNLREYVVAGGLISYAPSLAEVYRQAGIYVAKILKLFLAFLKQAAIQRLAL
jgi:putative tryptophan/tyrosine transport system substrate-binding protein